MTTLLVFRRFLVDYARNLTNLLLLVLVPVVFVLSAAPALADAARLLGGAGDSDAIGTVTAGWAASFLSAVAMYFQVADARRADRRLLTCGLARRQLVIGRLLVGATLAALATLAAVVALAARGGLEDPWRAGAGSFLFALIYMGIGAVAGATVTTAVNGTVLVLFVWILDVFFGPTMSGSSSWIVRALPTHFVSLWMADLPPGHGGPDELSWSLAWVVLSLAAAAVAVGASVSLVPARPRRGGSSWAQLRSGVRMGWREWRRTPVFWVLLAVVPAVFILLSVPITPHGQAPIQVRERGVTYTAIVDPADIHAGTMAPIAIGALATLIGVFMALDSRSADRRLALAGMSRRVLVASRLVLLLGAVAVTTSASLAVAATVFSPHLWWAYALGNVLVATMYVLVGVVLGPIFGRVSSVFLSFVVPFLDLGIWQSPMLRGEPASRAQWLPGYGGIRVMIDGALTDSFDEGRSLLIALAWIALFLAVAVLTLAPRTHGLRTGDGTRGGTARTSEVHVARQ
jgi:hypothetical protein